MKVVEYFAGSAETKERVVPGQTKPLKFGKVNANFTSEFG